MNVIITITLIIIIIIIIKVYIQDLGKSKRNIRCIIVRSSLIVLLHDPNQPPRGFYANELCSVQCRGDITTSLENDGYLGELKHGGFFFFLEIVHSFRVRSMKHLSLNPARDEQRYAKR